MALYRNAGDAVGQALGLRSGRFRRGQPCSQGARGNPARLVAAPGFDELLGYVAC